MKKIILTAVVAASILLSGCTVNLPFNNRLNYSSVTEMKSVSPMNEKINIVWEPNTFTERVDIQGASGFVGGGSRTRIPTGVAITNRVAEAISQYATVTPSGKKLVIVVLDASSTFEYSAGIFNVTPGMDVGGAKMNVEITFNGHTWKNTYQSYLKDPTIGAMSQTAILEQAWDNVAVQLAKDVASHM